MATANRPIPETEARRESVRACDACHVRRTKCSGGEPCIKCRKSSLRCTYTRPVRKKGPRGKTVQMLRATLGSPGEEPSDDETSVATTSAVTMTPATIADLDSFTRCGTGFVPDAGCELSCVAQAPCSAPSGRTMATLEQDCNVDFGLLSDTPSMYPVIPFPAPSTSTLPFYLRPLQSAPAPVPATQYHSHAPQLILLQEVLARLLQRYLCRIHRLFPIVDRDRLQTRFEERAHLHDKQFAAFLVAVCALALFASPCANIPAEAREQANTLVDMAINLHNTADLGSKPSLDCIGTSMVLAAVLLVLKGPSVAFVRHREAIAMAEAANLANPKAYDAFDPTEREAFLRILWMLACAERSNALLLMKPTAIRSTLSSFPVDFRLESALSLALIPTAKLFEVIAPPLIDCINGQCVPATCTFSTQTILAAHDRLEDIRTEGCLEVQTTDTLLTAQWLHIKLWQGCIVHSILNAESTCPELTIEYPLKVLAKVVFLVQTSSRRSILCNGQAMGRKLGNIVDVCRMALALPEPLNIPTEFRDKAHAVDALDQLQTLASEVSTQKWFRWRGENCNCCRESTAQ